MDMSGFADQVVLESCGYPFGLLFACGTFIAGALGRPFRLVTILGALSAAMNVAMMWPTLREFDWSHEPGFSRLIEHLYEQPLLPSMSQYLIFVGLLLAWIRGK